jgi:peptidoglycan/LPS O-acetylase OafA/YrhL
VTAEGVEGPARWNGCDPHLPGIQRHFSHSLPVLKRGCTVPYLRKRFLRLFPTLWVVTIPFLCASIAVGSKFIPDGTADRVELIVSSVLISGVPCQNPALDLLSSGYNLEFLVGVICGVLVRRFSIPAPRWVLIAWSTIRSSRRPASYSAP